MTVKSNKTVSIDDQIVPGMIAAEDPWDGKPVSIPANLAENPTLAMFNTKRRGKRLIDEAQLRAAMEVHRLWRRLHGRSPGVVDPSNEPVDVSPSGRDWTPVQENAGRRLAALRGHLGQKPYRLTILVAGHEIAPRLLTAPLLGVNEPTEADHKYMSRYYRETLGSAAEFFGFVSVTNQRSA